MPKLRSRARARPGEFCVSRGQRDGTKIIAKGWGSLFGAEVPQIEHEHDDEHDSLAAQWLKLLLWIAHYSKEEDRSALLVCDCG
jgi:hypothetical protein